MTMLEKVARGLAMSAGGAIVGPGQSRATREFGWKPDGVHLEKYVEAHWKEHIHAAEFAISAMREPTDEMATQAADAVFRGELGSRVDFEERWRVAIDAALAERPV